MLLCKSILESLQRLRLLEFRRQRFLFLLMVLMLVMVLLPLLYCEFVVVILMYVVRRLQALLYVWVCINTSY